MASAARTTASRLDVAIMLSARQVRLRSKRTVFGLVWPVLAPLILLALYVFVFKNVLKTRITDYPVFLFSGLLPWSFLAQTIGTSVQTLSSDADRIRNARFDYELLPVSNVVVMAGFFLVTLAGFVVFLAADGRLVLHLLPLLVLPLIAIFAFVCALAIVLSLIDVYNRDLRALLGNALTVWFFLVPIVYRDSSLPTGVRIAQAVDPMTMIIREFRNTLYWGRVGAVANIAEMLVGSGLCLLFALVLFRFRTASLPKDV